MTLDPRRFDRAGASIGRTRLNQPKLDPTGGKRKRKRVRT
jgi:hypothetical protein